MAFQMTNDFMQSSGVRMLCYGRAGVGKTMLCATLPNPLIISAEGGLLSLKKENIERVYGVDTPGITYNIPYATIRSFADAEGILKWLEQSPEAKQFASVALDSLSEIGEVLLASVKKNYKDGRQAYMEVIDRTLPLVRGFRDLPNKNVYFSSTVEQFRDEITGSIMYGPSMPGTKLGIKMPFLFDEVFAFRLTRNADNTTVRYLQTQPDDRYEAKDRSGALAPAEYPHLGAIINKIGGAT